GAGCARFASRRLLRFSLNLRPDVGSARSGGRAGRDLVVGGAGRGCSVAFGCGTRRWSQRFAGPAVAAEHVAASVARSGRSRFVDREFHRPHRDLARRSLRTEGWAADPDWSVAPALPGTRSRPFQRRDSSSLAEAIGLAAPIEFPAGVTQRPDDEAEE